MTLSEDLERPGATSSKTIGRKEMLRTTVRVGLIGAGGISRAHVPGWLALGAQVTVFSEEGADALAEEYQLTTVDSLDALLENSDIVDICTPTTSHLTLAEAALRVGKHVICEKPVALDVDSAEEVGRLADELGLGLFPAHVVRYFPEYVAAKQAVDAGSIGDVAIMRFSRVGEYPSWSPWFSDDALSGGIVVDQMIHDLDIARWIGGEVTEVFATVSRAEDARAVSAQVVLSHEGGAVSTVNGVWGAPGLRFRTSFSIAGSQGLLQYDSRDDTSFRLDTGFAKEGAMTRPQSDFVESPYELELHDFLNAVQDGDDPRVTWQDGMRAVEIAIAANRSIQSGQPVALSPITMEALA